MIAPDELNTMLKELNKPYDKNRDDPVAFQEIKTEDQEAVIEEVLSEIQEEKIPEENAQNPDMQTFSLLKSNVTYPKQEESDLRFQIYPLIEKTNHTYRCNRVFLSGYVDETKRTLENITYCLNPAREGGDRTITGLGETIYPDSTIFTDTSYKETTKQVTKLCNSVSGIRRLILWMK